MISAIMQSGFVQAVTDCLSSFFTTLMILGIVGFVGFCCGELTPRKWIRYDRFPFREYPFEKGGQLYSFLRVPKWKDKLPVMSTYVNGVFSKKTIEQSRTSEYFERFVIETCIAESVHVALMIGGFIVVPIFHNAWGVIAGILYMLGNLPFVLIQRYNRPRFRVLLERQRQIEERKRRQANANTKEDA